MKPEHTKSFDKISLNSSVKQITLTHLVEEEGDRQSPLSKTASCMEIICREPLIRMEKQAEER